MKSKLTSLLTNQKVIFVSTKNIDYIRNTQEINLIKQQTSQYKVIASPAKNYVMRLFYVYTRVLPILIKNDYDILFIGFASQLLFPLYPFKRKSKLMVIDFFISFYDTLIDDRKKFSPTGFMSKILHILDERTIHKADYVIADTKAHKDYFSSEFNVNSDLIEVLYLEADTTIYSNFNSSPNNLIKSPKYEVVYFGSILPVQGTEVILEATQLLQQDETIHFTIIGPIVDKFHLEPKNYPNVHFISWLSQEDLAKQINKADLALAGHFSKTVNKANRTIAGKTYIYKAMNKPIILGDSEANHELFIEDNKMNFYVERGNPQKLANKIKSVKKQIKE